MATPHGNMKYPSFNMMQSSMSAALKDMDLDLTAYAFRGSFAENLDTPESDYDMLLLIGTTKDISIHTSMGEYDFLIESAFNYAKNLNGHLDVSPILQFQEDDPFTPYLRNLRPNYYQATRSFQGSAWSNFKTTLKNTELARKKKFAKRTLKDIYREERLSHALGHGYQFNPRLSEEERELFYEEYFSLEEMFDQNPERAEACLASRLP